MKKKYCLTFAAALLSMAASAQLTTHSFASSTWQDAYGDTYDAAGYFQHVSANGLYAVGCDDQSQSASNGAPFLWRRSNPSEIEFLVSETSENRITAYDVTNDGVVVGSFEERDPDELEPVACYPGYRTPDGSWYQLPMPDSYSLSYAKTYDFLNTAEAVTPDGKYIAGQAFITVGYNSYWKLDIVYLTPILWEKVDGEYVLKQTYTNLGDEGKSYIYQDGELVKVDESVNYNQFVVWDISNDGSTIAGVNQAWCGGQNPAIIRNGEMIQLFDCDKVVDEEEESTGDFNGGICNSIDANGNVYGYFQEPDGSMKYFTYTADGKLVYHNNDFVTCGDKNGNTYNTSSEGVSYVLDCSEDGTVVAGAGLGSTGFGTYTYPMLASDDNATGIDERIANIRGNVSVDYRNSGNLFVNGEYDNATIYDAAGKQLMSGKQGRAFNMSQLPSGTYVVKVQTANGTKSFKVAR